MDDFRARLVHDRPKTSTDLRVQDLSGATKDQYTIRRQVLCRWKVESACVLRDGSVLVEASGVKEWKKV
jgi:hypothetical protein